MSVVAEPTTKERPILFSGEMVRAILDGRKTQTRRVVNPLCLTFPIVSWERWIVPPPPTYPHWPAEPQYTDAGVPLWGSLEADGTHREWACPYGEPGDRLWVRETWAAYSPVDVAWKQYKRNEREAYAPDQWQIEYAADGTTRPIPFWTPSIHMPRWASRITLEITGIRVQRVRSISGDDALREGVTLPTMANGAADPTVEFIALWDSINEPRGYGWAVNPWVWVVEFEQVPA